MIGAAYRRSADADGLEKQIPWLRTWTRKPRESKIKASVASHNAALAGPVLVSPLLFLILLLIVILISPPRNWRNGGSKEEIKIKITIKIKSKNGRTKTPRIRSGPVATHPANTAILHHSDTSTPQESHEPK